MSSYMRDSKEKDNAEIKVQAIPHKHKGETEAKTEKLQFSLMGRIRLSLVCLKTLNKEMPTR